MQDLYRNISPKRFSIRELLGHRVCVAVRDTNDVIAVATAHQNTVPASKMVSAATVPATATNPVTLMTPKP